MNYYGYLEYQVMFFLKDSDIVPIVARIARVATIATIVARVARGGINNVCYAIC